MSARTKDLTQISEMSRVANSPDLSSMSTSLDISSLTQEIKNSSQRFQEQKLVSRHRRQRSGSSFAELTARSASRQPRLELEASGGVELTVAADFYRLKEQGKLDKSARSYNRSGSVAENTFDGARLEEEQKHIFQGK